MYRDEKEMYKYLLHEIKTKIDSENKKSYSEFWANRIKSKKIMNYFLK